MADKWADFRSKTPDVYKKKTQAESAKDVEKSVKNDNNAYGWLKRQLIAQEPSDQASAERP